MPVLLQGKLGDWKCTFRVVKIAWLYTSLRFRFYILKELSNFMVWYKLANGLRMFFFLSGSPFFISRLLRSMWLD